MREKTRSTLPRVAPGNAAHPVVVSTASPPPPVSASVPEAAPKRKRGRPFKAGGAPTARRPAHVRAHRAIQNWQARVAQFAKTVAGIHTSVEATEEQTALVQAVKANTQGLSELVDCLFVDLEALVVSDFRAAVGKTRRSSFTVQPGAQVAIKVKYYTEEEMGDNNDLVVVSVGEKLVTLRHETNPKAPQLKLPLRWIEAASTALARATRPGKVAAPEIDPV